MKCPRVRCVCSCKSVVFCVKVFILLCYLVLFFLSFLCACGGVPQFLKFIYVYRCSRFLELCLYLCRYFNVFFFSFSFLSQFQGLSQSNFHIMNQSNQSLLSVEETNAKNKNTNKQLNRL